MAMISKDLIEQIRSQSNIVEVIGSYLPQLKRRGSTFKCNCPFHQEKTPSFTVNESRQIYHCFGCSAGGDVYRFIMEYDKVDFVTAVKILADRVGVEVVFEGGGSESGGNKDVLYKIHADASVFYHRLLMKSELGAEARRYLEERDLPDEIIKEFQLGYSPNEWDGLLKKAQSKGYDTDQLETAGLIVPSDRGGRKSYYDRFRNRVMFPICDQMGRVIGFSGRIMNKAEKGAKYVNSPETPLFHKSHVLFAFDKARKAIVDARQAIVVEGQIDAIRCHLAGLTNVVASQGTALTESHARLIKRYADEVVLVLDSDAAGEKAALSSSEIFIASELSVRVATLPKGEDPDSLVKTHGAESLRELVSEAPSALEFLMTCLSGLEDMGTEAGRMRVIQSALSLIRHCPGAARRDQMLQLASEKLGVSIGALKQDLRRATRVQQRKTSPKTSSESVPVTPQKEAPPEELSVLELLVHHHSEVQPLIHDYLPARLLADPICKEVLEILMVDLPETLMEMFHDFEENIQQVVSRIQVDERKIDNETSPVELAQQYIRFFWKRQLERDQAALQKNDENWFVDSTRLKHDLFAINKDWNEALPIIETHLHNG